jgi:PhnB protein
MRQISPYVGFNGKCREAMTFYHECLGGELTLQTVGETPFAAQCPESMHQQIMHSTLQKDGQLIMGSDMVAPEGFVLGNNVALSANCSSEEEINTLYAKLAEGGKIIDELKTQFWGAIFGVVTDKFGVRWMFNYEKS